MDSDLDMTVDEESWIKEHPVYCPVSWCSAHNLRHARCGDVDGPYEGLHVARIQYARGESQRVKRQIANIRKMGVSNPELSFGMSQLFQEALDTGLVPLQKGLKRGRRRLA